jgi:hypothetical protein
VDLAACITVRREKIVRRFVELLARTEVFGPMSRSQLVDEVPAVLADVAQALQEATTGRLETGALRRHGAQRFALGFDLKSVVREYGVLCQCVLDVAAEDGVYVTNQEAAALARALFDAACEAVAEFVRRAAAAEALKATGIGVPVG